ncbi:MAG: L-threonylcarbamoyladenylate synthase [Candidatus Saccharicenans sp.]|nr:L-threonylcarbamoyladenylate synthase [Candidatus Saccharicenans sp.]MDH7493870.1 L-threonylcarbamoyladenylate synthase [Candidatus Saccharicenans sp.]
MPSLVLPLPAWGLKPDQLDFISERLGQGAILVYPTETFYGLGGLAALGSAAEKIFDLKGRETGKPLPFVASKLEMVLDYAEKPSDLFYRLAERFWPGPLTLVLRARENSLPEILYGPGRTIAVRIPPLAWLRDLIQKSGSLLISTSANLSGQPPLASFQEVYEIFRDRVDLFIDGGPTPGGRPSTIIDLTAPEPVCLREGKIPAAEVWAYVYER